MFNLIISFDITATFLQGPVASFAVSDCNFSTILNQKHSVVCHEPVFYVDIRLRHLHTGLTGMFTAGEHMHFYDHSKISYLPVWAIRGKKTNTRFKSSSNRDAVLLSFYSTWDSAHGVFPARISTTTTTENPSPGAETPSLSVLCVPVWIYRWWHCCQSGSTPTRTLRAHAIGACAPFPLSWLVRHGRQSRLCPGTRITCCSLCSSHRRTFNINILRLLSSDRLLTTFWKLIYLKENGWSVNEGIIHLKVGY